MGLSTPMNHSNEELQKQNVSVGKVAAVDGNVKYCLVEAEEVDENKEQQQQNSQTPPKFSKNKKIENIYFSQP